MFDLPTFIMLCVIVVLANAFAIPKLVDYSAGFLDTPRDKNAPKIMLINLLSKGLLISLVACSIGSYMAPKVGLGAPFIEAVAYLDNPHIVLWDQMAPIVLHTFYVLLGMMFLQYLFISRHVSTTRYFEMPFTSKVLLEGVIEEIVFRWGLVSFLTRILIKEATLDPNLAIIIAIFLAAVGSGLSHISDLTRLNFQRLDVALLSILLLNFWGALCYGFLFWKHGLTAAILCHVLVVSLSVAAYKFCLALTDVPNPLER
jgi:hypothetical protein